MTGTCPGLRLAKLAPYELIAPIGAAGMGEVWKARDVRLDRAVAIKFAHSRFSERFEREARAVTAEFGWQNVRVLEDFDADAEAAEYILFLAELLGGFSCVDADGCIALPHNLWRQLRLQGGDQLRVGLSDGGVISLARL